MSQLSVRQAQPRDVSSIARIHVRSWQAAYRGILPDSLLDSLSVPEREQSWRAILSAAGEHSITLVAESVSGDLDGFCSIATPSRDHSADLTTAEIGALYVDPDHWREGVGGAMLSAGLGELAGGGWQDVILWVLPENERALTFYESFGFFVEQGIEKLEERSGRPVIRLRLVLASADEPIKIPPDTQR